MAEHRFDRAAAERILQRAIQLEEDHDPASVFEGLSESTLREAAEELGVPASMVRQAAAEERLGVLAPTGRRGDRVVGPAVVTAVRVVDGDRAEVLDRSDAWLRRAAFRRRRSSASFAEYSRRTDPVAAAQRAVRSVGGREGLGSIRHLRVLAEPVADDATVLALIVDLSAQRRLTLTGGTSVAGAGIAASSIEAALTSPWIWLGVPASAAAGYGILRVRAHGLADVELTLEGALDRIASSVVGAPGATRTAGTETPSAASRGDSTSPRAAAVGALRDHPGAQAVGRAVRERLGTVRAAGSDR